jgi:hypothetical protein
MRDKDVRAALHQGELAHYHADPHSRVVEELGIFQGDFRIDVAVVNGSLHGWEIKSARDTLDRLPAQAEAYAQVFDFMTLVAAQVHLDRAVADLPAFWGLCLALPSKAGVVLRPVRPAVRNKSTDVLSVAQLLWSTEVIELLEANGGARGLRGRPRRQLWRALVDRMEPDALRFAVREAIKRRPKWREAMPAGS